MSPTSSVSCPRGPGKPSPKKRQLFLSVDGAWALNEVSVILPCSPVMWAWVEAPHFSLPPAVAAVQGGGAGCLMCWPQSGRPGWALAPPQSGWATKQLPRPL